MSAEDQFLVGVEVDPSGITQGLIGGERAVSSFTDKLDRAERGLRKAQGAMDLYGEAGRRQNTVAAQQLRALNEEARALAANVQHIRSRTTSAAGLLRTEEVRARVAAAGVTAESRLGQAIAQQTRVRQQLQAQLRASIAAQEQENRVTANVAGVRARVAAMQEEIRATREGVETLRQYREMVATQQEVAATGAVPGSPGAADAEREAQTLVRLRGELAAVTAARERDDAAAARATTAIAELEAENRQLLAASAAHRQGAAAVRAYNEQQAVSNALQRAGVAAGSAHAQSIERLVRDNSRLRRETDELTAAQHRQERGVGNLRNAFNSLQAVLLGLGLGQLIRSSIELVTQWERAERTFTVVTGSLSGAHQQLAFIRQEADRLGLVFTSAAVQFSQFLAASKGALPLRETQEVFIGITEALSNLGATEQQTERALLGLSQAMSKGTLGMEELRQQLGDALPLAMQLAAKAADMPLAKFTKMVEQGKILSSDIVPGLAREARSAFGTAGAAIESTQAKLNRFKNATDDLRRSFGEGFLSGLLEGFSTLQKTMTSAEIQQAARDLGEDLGTALRRAADAVASLARNFELLKGVLLAVVSLKVASFFVGLAASIIKATGATIAFKAVASNLALAGGLGGIAVALLAVIVVLNKYIAASRLALEIELDRVAKSQEFFGYLSTLKANKIGLTEAEHAYGVAVRETMAAERAGLAVSLARTQAQLAAAQTRNPFKYQQVAGPGRNVLAEQAKDQARELQTIDNQLKLLDREWSRLGQLPVIKLPVDSSAVDGAGKKITNLLETFRRAAEQAERIAGANRQGAAEALGVTEAIERENAAYGALNSIEGLSAASKQRLTAIIGALVGRTQEATKASAELIATRERDLAFATAGREAEAQLADARVGGTAASRALAVALEAEGIAREEGREKDAAYIRQLADGIAVRHEYLATITAEIAALGRGREAEREVITLQAKILDVRTSTNTATRQAAELLEIEALLITEGVQAWEPRAAQLRQEVQDRNAVRAALEGQLAVTELLIEQESARAHIDAELANFQQAQANAARFGDELGDLASRYGLLGSAVDELILRERILAAVRDAGIDTATKDGFLLSLQIEDQIRQTYEAEKAARAYVAAVEAQRYVLEPLKEGWRQVGDTIRSAVVDAILDGKLSIEDLGKTLLRVMLDAIFQMLIRWIAAHKLMQAEAAKTAAANAAAANAGSAGGGGVSAGGGGGVGGISWGAVWAAVAGGAALAYRNWARNKGNAEVSTNVQLGGGEGVSVGVGSYNSLGGLDRYQAQLKQMAELVRLVREFIVSVGGQIDEFESARSEIEVRREGRGKNTEWFVEYANGLVRSFGGDMEAAMDFAAVQAIRQAPTIGLSPEVRQALEASTAETMEQLQKDMETALAVVHARLGEAGSRYYDAERSSGREIAAAAALGLATDHLIAARDRERVAMRNQLLGIDTSTADFLASLGSFNRGLEEAGRGATEALAEQIRRAEEQIRDLEARRSAPPTGPREDPGGRSGFGTDKNPGGEDWSHFFAASFWDPVQAQFQEEINKLKEQVERYNAELAKIPKALSDHEINASIFGALYKYVEGTKEGAKYAELAREYALEKVRAEFAAIKLQLILLGKWEQFAALWTDALAATERTVAADIGRRPGGGGGGGNRQEERADFVRDLERAGLRDLRREILAARDAFTEAGRRIKELGFRGEEAARLLEAARQRMERELADATRRQVTSSQEFINRGGAYGGDVMAGLTDLDRTAQDLIQGNRDLEAEGRLTKKEMRDLNNAIREANKRQKEQLVRSATSALLLDLYQLLGDEKEAAKIKYELTLAELILRREELVLAYQRLGLEFAALGIIDDLIAKVIAAGPALFGPREPGDAGPQGNDNLERLQREREQRNIDAAEVFRAAVLDFRAAIADLARSTAALLVDDQLSPLTATQKLQQATADYQATLAAARGGDLDALRRFDSVRRTLLEIAQSYYAGGGDAQGLGPAYQALFQQILQDTATLATPEVEQATAAQALLDLFNGQQAGQDQQHEDLTAIHDQLVAMAGSVGGTILASSSRFPGGGAAASEGGGPVLRRAGANDNSVERLLEEVVRQLKGLGARMDAAEQRQAAESHRARLERQLG